MNEPPPTITPAKVIITLLLLVAAGCTAGLFMVPLGTTAFWGLLIGAVIAGAGAMSVPMKAQ